MLHLLTMLQALIAVLALVFGGGFGAVLLNSSEQIATPTTEASVSTPLAEPDFASPVASPVARADGELLDGPVQQFDDPVPDLLADEPLDRPLTGDETVVADADASENITQDDEALDAPLADDDVAEQTEPLDDIERRLQDEPLDAPVLAQEPLDDGRAELDEPAGDDRVRVDEPVTGDRAQVEEPLDAPRPEPDVAVVPPASDENRPPIVEAADPLDAPVGEDVAQVEPGGDVVDAPRAPAPVAVVPAPVQDTAPPPVTSTTAPVPAPAQSAPVSAKSEPVAVDTAKPVTSVRSKGATQDPVIVVAGRRPLPASLASCDVSVGAGRSTVGVGCDDTPVTAAHQPAIPRVPGSASLVSTDGPATITSRRDGVQIGEYADPTLGESIATTVRAAIFPEDVVVPDVLIVPGELTVAGNTSREDPIVVWRSELEQASRETGIPVEMLATVIRVASNGDPGAESPTGVGLMHVPIEELIARGISREQWVDPATNITIGAQLLVDAAASPSDVLSGAAVTNYLAGTCDEAPDCLGATSSQVNEWIVYYRLRATNHPAVTAVAGDVTTEGSNWPFSDEVAAPSTDPIADREREQAQAEREAERTRNLPTLSAAKPEDEPEWNWPWTPPSGE